MRFSRRLKFLIRYFNYRFVKSNTKHQIHSPFVYNLLTKVIDVNMPFTDFDKIEKLRTELGNSNEEISVNDLGAGSYSKKMRKIKEIVNRSAKSPKYTKLLYRLVNHFKPNIAIELGTSLGMSTLYQSFAMTNGRIITIEGCKETAQKARNNFSKLNANNIESIIGNFDEQLPLIIDKVDQLDFVFFDGNHRKEPTLNYFQLCLKKIHNETIFVFDDIHWSDEMEEAWEIIKNDNEVVLTIDLFFLGLVFFRKEQKRQNFILKY